MPPFSDISFEQLPLQAKLRIDSICARFESAWTTDPDRPRLETFSTEVPDAEQPVLLAELLFIEIECRQRSGETPCAEDYLGRFPTHEALIREALPMSARHETLNSPAGRPTDRIVPPTPGPMTVPGYEVFEELGRGGMGVVYEARHVALNRLVALKFILAGRHAHSGQQDRFRREAEVIARLRHPNIIQIYDIGETDGRYYLALEHADAGSLRDRLAGVPLEPRLAVILLEPLVRAVQHAHRQGIIHRDIKPANILLATGGDSVMHGHRDLSAAHLLFEVPQRPDQWALATLTPKLTDFGLAQFVDHVGAGEAGMPAGTPSYMAPEQVTNKTNPGPATDIWALGVTLYELLTGRPPFRAATAIETLRLVLEVEPVPPGQLQPSVPQDLETICLKCLQKEPEKRYPGARDLAQDLRHFLAGEAIQARRAGWGERLVKWARRRPAKAALVLALAGSLLVGFCGVTAAMFYAFAGWEQARSSTQAALDQQRSALPVEEEYLSFRVDSEGRHLLTATRGGKIRRRDLTTRKGEESAWHVRPAPRFIVCSPDATRVLVGEAAGDASLRDAATGQVVGASMRHEAVVTQGIFSPDNSRLFTGCADGTVRGWSRQGKSLPLVRKHPQPVRRLALTADGRWLAVAIGASGVEGAVWVWNLGDEKAKPRILHSLERTQEPAHPPSGRP